MRCEVGDRRLETGDVRETGDIRPETKDNRLPPLPSNKKKYKSNASAVLPSDMIIRSM